MNNLLIHHHASIYVDPVSNEMFTYSFIGRWVNAISPLVDNVGLLFNISEIQTNKHDTLLIGQNIFLEDLGVKEKFIKRKLRKNKFKNKSIEISDKYNCIIIRGITPRQKIVSTFFTYPRMYFLLVGSIVDSKPNFQFSLKFLYLITMYFWRRRELQNISEKYIFFTNSPKVVNELNGELNITSKYIPTNSIKLDEIPPFRLKKINKDSLTLLFCGRVVKDKGIFELLEAFSILLKENTRHKLLIVGEISVEIFKQIQSVSYYDKISKNIEFKGFVPFGNVLLDLYDKSDFYILPSYHEGFPHSIWESASQSTHVLTTAVGGIPSILDNSKVTFIEKKSSLDIYNKIKECCNNEFLTHHKCHNIYLNLLDNTVEMCAHKLLDEIRIY